MRAIVRRRGVRATIIALAAFAGQVSCASPEARLSTWINRSRRGVDFYQYANSNWIKNQGGFKNL